MHEETEFLGKRYLDIVKLWRFDSPFIDEMRHPDMFRMFITSWRNRPEEALQMHGQLPEEMQTLPIVLEERSSAQIASGDCRDALDSLDQAHGGVVRVYGQVPPSSPRSNSNLALNRVWCLRELGRKDEADSILKQVEAFVMRLRDSATYNYYSVDAKLRLIKGDTGGVLSVLEAAWARMELEFSTFGDPVLRTLAGEPRFEVLRNELTTHVNAEREKLGWAPAVL